MITPALESFSKSPLPRACAGFFKGIVERESMRIYCITNLSNGKRYIGQTTQTIRDRWAQHCTRTGCRALARAISKYGVDAFSIREIATAESQDELNRIERFWIAHLNTLSPNGYNLTDGGGSGGKMSDETRAVMREKANTPQRIKRALQLLQNPQALARAKESRSKSLAAGIGKKTGPNKNGVGEPRPAYQAHWDDPEWKAMMIAKRQSSEGKRKAAIAITDALPETKQRRSDACRIREARPEVKARRILDAINREAKKRQARALNIERKAS